MSASPLRPVHARPRRFYHVEPHPAAASITKTAERNPSNSCTFSPRRPQTKKSEQHKTETKRQPRLIEAHKLIPSSSRLRSPITYSPYTFSRLAAELVSISRLLLSTPASLPSTSSPGSRLPAKINVPGRRRHGRSSLSRRAHPHRGRHAVHGHRRQRWPAMDGTQERNGLLCARD